MKSWNVTNELFFFFLVIQFLSMKLASANPMFYDFGMDLDALMVKPEVIGKKKKKSKKEKEMEKPMKPIFVFLSMFV